ncbi:unknown [Bacteroides sp. CAG:714]|nr:unknown [Bacteroides sp. CAG:714]
MSFDSVGRNTYRFCQKIVSYFIFLRFNRQNLLVNEWKFTVVLHHRVNQGLRYLGIFAQLFGLGIVQASYGLSPYTYVHFFDRSLQLFL